MLSWTAEEVRELGRRFQALRIYGVFGARDWAPALTPIPWGVPVACEDLPTCMQPALHDLWAHPVTTPRRAMDRYCARSSPREARGLVRACVPAWRPGGVAVQAVVLEPLPSLEDPAAWSLMRAALAGRGAWQRSVQQLSVRAALRALREVGHEVRPILRPTPWWLLRAPAWVRRVLRRLLSRWEAYPALSVLASAAREHGVDVFEQGAGILAWAGTCAAGGWPFDAPARLAEAMGSELVPLAQMDGQLVCVRLPGSPAWED